MQAIILAAGMGRRLKELTKNQAKCMVPVNDRPLIERMLNQLDCYGLNRIIIVAGHCREQLEEYITALDINTPVTYILNPIYSTTNNIYSLYLAKDYLMEDDTILLESDLIFESGVLEQIMTDPYPNLALVAPFESWMDGTVVVVDQEYHIKNFLTRKDFRFEDIKTYYKTINIYKFSAHFSQSRYVPFLEAYSKALGNNEYYEQVLKVITLLDDHELKALKLKKGFWYEIDDEQDLDIAESIFTGSKHRLNKISRRYGGYWRYPELLDYCYLVNPFFPNKKLIEEIQANFQQLITSYPSGRDVNNLLMAKTIGLRKEHIVVGNGAAELIRPLMESISGKIGIIHPTFEEYSQRAAETVPFLVKNRNYTYSAADIINYYKDKEIDALVLINPDNPSGSYLTRSEVREVLQFCRNKSALLILDESFVDFSDEPDATLLKQEVLDANPHLIVIKSISKSYGVPGLRLGLMASTNPKVIPAVTAGLPIWNINSFAEYFLQILEKYQQEYQESLIRFRKERCRMYEKLLSIQQLRPIPSQANYIVCQVLDGGSSTQIAELLLNRYNILIKDLSAKEGLDGTSCFRIAIKTPPENDRLIEALKHILR